MLLRCRLPAMHRLGRRPRARGRMPSQQEVGVGGRDLGRAMGVVMVHACVRACVCVRGRTGYFMARRVKLCTTVLRLPAQLWSGSRRWPRQKHWRQEWHLQSRSHSMRRRSPGTQHATWLKTVRSCFRARSTAEHAVRNLAKPCRYGIPGDSSTVPHSGARHLPYRYQLALATSVDRTADG